MKKGICEICGKKFEYYMRHNRIQWTCSGRCGNEAQKRTWENKKAHWIDIELNGGISERQKYIDGAKRRYLNEKALVDKKLALNEKVCYNIYNSTGRKLVNSKHDTLPNFNANLNHVEKSDTSPEVSPTHLRLNVYLLT